MKDALISELGSRVFSDKDQQVFACLSGDFNPSHLDSLAARRSLTGAVVVHGMHTLLWSLEVLASSNFRPESLKSMDVRFPKPLYLGESVSISLHKKDADSLRLKAVVGAKTVALIRFGLGEAQQEPTLPGTISEAKMPALELHIEMMKNRAGTIGWGASKQQMEVAFPEACALIGTTRVLGLATCSRLVGMECPGRKSLLSRLAVFLSNEGGDLSYKVASVDDRFLSIQMEVSGSGLQGVVEAFTLPQGGRMSYVDLAKPVSPDVFSDQIALVIGGSRGLGEITAKLIAAGGGRVFLSYAVGQKDVEKIVEEIRAAGGKAEAFLYDVKKPASDQLDALQNVEPTHLYYFATGQIFRPKIKAFDPDTLSHFMDFYVHGFYRLCEALMSRKINKALSVFYPSSISVQERPKDMTEYAMAKSAGEILCADLPHMLPGIKIVSSRLPRLPTDQTISVIMQETENPVDHLLPTLLAMT